MMPSVSLTETFSIPEIQVVASCPPQPLQAYGLSIEALATTESLSLEVIPAQPENDTRGETPYTSERLRDAINYVVDVPISSPSIYQYRPAANLWFGTPEMVPEILGEQWSSSLPVGIKLRLDLDLEPTRRKMRRTAARRGRPRSESDFNAELRMSGYRTSLREQHVSLSPCLWIFCASSWVVKGVRKALKGIGWIKDLIRVEICVGGASFCSAESIIPIEQLGSIADAQHSVNFGGGQFLYHIARLRPELASPSICGWLCCATYTKEGQVVDQRVSRIGGMLTSQLLDNELLSFHNHDSVMTTAHGMFGCTDFEDSTSNSDTDIDDESESEESEDVEGQVDEWRLERPAKSTQSFSNQLVGDIDVKTVSSGWIAFDSVPGVNFSSHCGSDRGAHSRENTMMSDYMLLKTETVRLLHNSYLLRCPDSEIPRVEVINTYSTEQELSPGPIWLILGFDDVEQASLLPGKSTIYLGGREIAVQKILLRAPLVSKAQGTSGSWLARGSSFCGMVIAGHAGEPLALVITARDILSDLACTHKAFPQSEQQVSNEAALRSVIYNKSKGHQLSREASTVAACEFALEELKLAIQDAKDAKRLGKAIKWMVGGQITLSIISLLVKPNVDPKTEAKILRALIVMLLSMIFFALVSLHRLSTLRKNIAIKKRAQKTYNSGDSLVVTDPTTNPPLTGLTKGERTGSRILQWVWPYVLRNGPEQLKSRSGEAEVDDNDKIAEAAMTSRCPAGPASTESGPARRRLSKRPGSSRPSVIGTNTWGVDRYATGG
ncbi:hypothetical protein FDECE_5626 [Fusarium decemcellulare]|nr:hypothetical protein FDECE_5626 [Fusarium decemcellulare]